jgi:hypothetical protein
MADTHQFNNFGSAMALVGVGTVAYGVYSGAMWIKNEIAARETDRVISRLDKFGSIVRTAVEVVRLHHEVNDRRTQDDNTPP